MIDADNDMVRNCEDQLKSASKEGCMYTPSRKLRIMSINGWLDG